MVLQTSLAQQIETLFPLTGTLQFSASKKYRALEHLRKGYRAFLATLGMVFRTHSVELSHRSGADA
ncbi:hypothetical protein [Ralstonia pseudosolanacearum]|uniref:hypothetical protein n=1 Tax=Ralstonia pseudosolanacearum TaxID=1310165 RepID=UPI001FFC1269|nr:hypothetical protein [Ralstonia pseudosolanacearum]